MTTRRFGDDLAALRAWLDAEAAAPFSGWDFSYLDGRMNEAPLPWDYRALVTAALPKATALLDMGTGGGEFLASLAPLPPTVCATEGYPPNLPLARERLAPLGITVSEIPNQDAPPLPYAAATFDLIIDRHEAYDPQEVLRILRPGGTFITQQVGGTNDLDLNQLLEAEGGTDYLFWNLAYAQNQLVASGLQIEQVAEAFPAKQFTDAGAIAYYLKAAPWQIPDFSVERYFSALTAIQRRCEMAGGVTLRAHYFMLVATKVQG